MAASNDKAKDDAADASDAMPNYKGGLLERSYFPAVAVGLANTIKHVLRNDKNTQQYPEEKRQPHPGYRGEHRLKRDELGREKCTACFMCATACPAHCIEIVAEEAPWDDREKRPRVFNIDMMRCIYCGLCEWACPCDAIELTESFNVVSRTRQEKIYNKEKLMSM